MGYLVGLRIKRWSLLYSMVGPLTLISFTHHHWFINPSLLVATRETSESKYTNDYVKAYL